MISQIWKPAANGALERLHAKTVNNSFILQENTI